MNAPIDLQTARFNVRIAVALAGETRFLSPRNIAPIRFIRPGDTTKRGPFSKADLGNHK
jgi:hypothetical protein